MKKYFLFVFAFTLFALSTPVFAETKLDPRIKFTPPAKIDINEVNKQINEDSNSGIRIKDVVFENKIYEKNDVVNIVLPVENLGNIDIPDVSVSAFVWVRSKDGTSKNYGFQDNLAPSFLPKKTSKDLSFEFKMPSAIDLKGGETARIEVSVRTKSGMFLGSAGNPIVLGSFFSAINISEAHIEANDKKYGLQEGPTVSIDKSPKLFIKIKNNNLVNINLTPKLNVYDIQPNRTEVGNKAYDSFLLKPGATKDLVLELPIFSKAGVYSGQLSFYDESGQVRSSFVASRWIVGGEMATISSVNIDKSSFKKGEEALVSVEFTGAPIDIGTASTTDIGVGIIKVSLFNEDKEIIATSEKEVSLNTLLGSTTLKMPISKNAFSVSANVKIMKGDKELANYDTTLTDPNIKAPDNTYKYVLWGILVLVLVLIIMIVVFFVKKKKSSKTLLLTLFFVGTVSILNVNIASAAVDSWLSETPTCYGSVCGNNNLYNVVNSLNKTSFSAGQNVGEYVYTHVYAYVCANQPMDTTVVYSIYNKTTGALITSTPARSYTQPNGGEYNWYMDYGAFSASTATFPTSLVAPTEVGSYVLRLDIYSTFASGGHGWRYYGPMTVYFDFNVVPPPDDFQTILNGGPTGTSTADLRFFYMKGNYPMENYEVDVSEDSSFGTIKERVTKTPGVYTLKNENIKGYISGVFAKFIDLITPKVFAAKIYGQADTSIDGLYGGNRQMTIEDLKADTTYYFRARVKMDGIWGDYKYLSVKTYSDSEGLSVVCNVHGSTYVNDPVTVYAYLVRNSVAVNPESYTWQSPYVRLSDGNAIYSAGYSSVGTYTTSVSIKEEGTGETATGSCVISVSEDLSGGCGPKPQDPECVSRQLKQIYICENEEWKLINTDTYCGSENPLDNLASCTHDGLTFKDSETRKFWQDRIAKNCVGAEAYCINGTLKQAASTTLNFDTDTFRYQKCAEPVPVEF